MIVKDWKRYAQTGSTWGYYNFNHHEPKAPTAKLRMNEGPRVDVHLVRYGESPGGIGEPGTAVTAAALSNAIYATRKAAATAASSAGLVLGAR